MYQQGPALPIGMFWKHPGCAKDRLWKAEIFISPERRGEQENDSMETLREPCPWNFYPPIHF